VKEQFITKKFTWDTEVVIHQANEIIEQYQEDNMTLTLRQLYYQFVSRDLLANNKKEYARLGRILSDGREAGLVDWDAIEDRTRNLEKVQTFNDPGDILRTCYYSFKIDHWLNQEYYIEVWIEKQALIGVIEPICRDYHVPWFACKGYVSKSEMYASAKRMAYQRDQGREPLIIHLGDHDPSGVDMTRDIGDQQTKFDGTFNVKRIALNMDQIEMYNPPPNYTKLSDSRSKDYCKTYGNDSWELDALDPKVMQKLIKDEVLQYRNQEEYAKTLKQEAQYKSLLGYVYRNWENITDHKEGDQDGKN